MKIKYKTMQRFVAIATLLMLSIPLSISAASANIIDMKDSTTPKDEILTGEAAEKYLSAVEENEVYNDLSSSVKLIREDSKGNEAKVQIVSLLENDTFGNDVVIVESRVNNEREHIGVLALVDKNTLEVFSISTITEARNFFGIVVTEYHGETGEILIQNILDEKGNVAESDSQLSKIERGSFWWKVICNLSTGGSCALGCLALVAVPGGYPACTLLCSAFASGTAC